MGTFTLFVTLPNEEVCSLRNLASGTSIRNVRKKLELSAGLPAQTYRLTCAQGTVMHEDHELRLDVNVWDGFLLRAAFLESWAELYEGVARDDATHVIQHGAVYMRADVVWIAGEDEGRAQEVTRERGVIALYLASFLGLRDMCKALLSVGVDPDGRTPFGRTALFVAMSRDHDHVMELLLARDASLEARDVDGVTAEDVARRCTAKQCLRKIRHWKLHHRHGSPRHEDEGTGARAATAGPGGRRREPAGGFHARGGLGGGLAQQRQDHLDHSVSSSTCSGPVSKRQAGRANTTVQRDKADHFERAGSLLSAPSSSYTATTATAGVYGSREEGGPSWRPAGGRGDGAARLRARRAVMTAGGRPASGVNGNVRASRGNGGAAGAVPPPQTLFKTGELYTWDNNLTRVGRAPSAAGTQARIPPSRPGEGGGGGARGGGRSLSAKRTGSASTKAGSSGVSWGETTSISSAASSRMLPCRPTVFALSVDNPGYVLSASSPCLSSSYAATTTTTTVRSVEAYGSSASRRPDSAAAARFSARPSHHYYHQHPSSFSSSQPDPSPLPRLQSSSSLQSLTGHGPEDVVTAVEDQAATRQREDQDPHGPAQEPPGRPPTRNGDHAHKADVSDSSGVGYHHHQQGPVVGHGSVMGSQEALSVGSAPEMSLDAGRGGEDAVGAGLGAELGPDGDNGVSDDDGGRVLVSARSAGKGSRRSVRFRTHQLVTRMKEEQKTRRTMQRRIKLAEDLKTTSAKVKTKEASSTQQPETFEQWLDRKRKERQRSRNNSDDDTSEEDEDDVRNRTAENSQAFNDWLKDLKERPLRRPHTSTPASLHRRKTRPLKDVIQIDARLQGPVEPPDVDSYMMAYQHWQQSKDASTSNNHTSGMDVKEAKKQLEEKRKSMLAMALTYEDWLEHTEERKKLMQVILSADMTQLGELEQQVFRTRRAPRQITFNQWLDKIDKKETEMRQQRQRMRREAEMRQQDGYMGDGFMRSSAAIAHEEWVRRKKEEALRERRKDKRHSGRSGGGDSSGGGGGGSPGAGLSEDEKRAAWEEWLNQKHKRQMAQMGQHIRKERQLLFTLRQKKNLAVTPC